MSSTLVAAPESSFLTDIKTLRERARQHIQEGAVTEDYKADRETVLRLLNEALATELVCVLRYRRHHFMARGINAEPIAAEFLVHANEEQQHADSIAARIVQLGGEPNFSPEGLATRSHSEYVEADGLVEMVKENLVAERIAIDSYGACWKPFWPWKKSMRTSCPTCCTTSNSKTQDGRRPSKQARSPLPFPRCRPPWPDARTNPFGGRAFF